MAWGGGGGGAWGGGGGGGTPRTNSARLVVATRNPAGVGSGHRVANPRNGDGLNEASWRRGRFARNHGRVMQPRGVLGTLPLERPQRGSRRPAAADADDWGLKRGVGYSEPLSFWRELSPWITLASP